jgi:hypothetical protein
MWAARLARNDLGTLVPSPRPAFRTQGIPVEQKSGKASLKIRFSHAEDRMARNYHVVLLG